MYKKTFFIPYEEEELKELIIKCVFEAIRLAPPIVIEEEKTAKSILTRKEVSEILGISLPTLDSYKKQGLIKAFQLGNKVRFRISDVQQALIEIKAR